MHPGLGRRATVAGMEGLAHSAGIVRHSSDAWALAQAAAAQGEQHCFRTEPLVKLNL